MEGNIEAGSAPVNGECHSLFPRAQVAHCARQPWRHRSQPMPQIKKDDVREAILASAFRLFSARGYIDTSIPAIARSAGISTANVYVYFPSKMDMLSTLYEPWLQERLGKLGRALRRIKDPQARLRRLLLALWRDLPREANGFASIVMQAVSSAGSTGDYSPRLRELFLGRVAAWLQECLLADARQARRIASVLLMAFDGFAMNARLPQGIACDKAMADFFASSLTLLAQARDH